MRDPMMNFYTGYLRGLVESCDGIGRQLTPADAVHLTKIEELLGESQSITLTLEKQIKISGGLKCPNCDDSGAYMIEVIEGDGVYDAEQCEFCYTIDDSIFNRKMKAEAGTG